MNKLYGELKTSLTRFAYRYFKTPHDIEDVVQEAFVKVIEAQSTREISKPQSYLYQTVKNLSLNRLDKYANNNEQISDDQVYDPIEAGSGTLEQQFDSEQRLAWFCEVVRELPIKCQRVYILRRVYGYGPSEIADLMGISKKTVEAHLTKAIVRVTDRMSSTENQRPSEYYRQSQKLK